MKYKKIIILVIILIIALTSCVLASDLTNGITINKTKAKEAEGIGNVIFGIVRVIGIILSVGTLMLLGIKYMLGSVEEKAEYKKSFGIYILGATLVFAVTVFAEKIKIIVESMLS